MVKSKRNRVFLGIVTAFLALAGTGLTIANNVSSDVKMSIVGITLAACFSAAEITFLWAHKTYEEITRLWRKVTLAGCMVFLVGSMSLALWAELGVALGSIANRGASENVAQVLSAANAHASGGRKGERERRANSAAALSEVGKFRLDVHTWPFVICYLVTGLASIVILGVGGEKRKAPREGKGNLYAQADRLDVRAWADRNIATGPGDRITAYAVDGGVAYKVNGRYVGFASSTELTVIGGVPSPGPNPSPARKKSIGFTVPTDPV